MAAEAAEQYRIAAGREIVSFVRACRRRFWRRRRLDAILNASQTRFAAQWRCVLGIRRVRNMRAVVAAAAAAVMQHRHGAAGTIERAWRNYANYIYFPAAYAMQHFLRSRWDRKTKWKCESAAVTLEAFARVVLSKADLGKRRTFALAWERQRFSAESDHASLAVIDAVRAVRATMAPVRPRLWHSARADTRVAEAARRVLKRATDAAKRSAALTPPWVPPNIEFARTGTAEKKLVEVGKVAALAEDGAARTQWRGHFFTLSPVASRMLTAWRHQTQLDKAPAENEMRGAVYVAARAKDDIQRRLTPKCMVEQALLVELSKISNDNTGQACDQENTRTRDTDITRQDWKRPRKHAREARERNRSGTAEHAHQTRAARRWLRLHADAAFAVGLFAEDDGQISGDAFDLAADALRAARGAEQTHVAFRIRGTVAQRGAAVSTTVATEALARVAGLADFKRPFLAAVRGDRARTSRWRPVIFAATVRALELDAATSARVRAITNFRSVRGPHQACARCGAAFALLRDIRDHELRDCRILHRGFL